MEVFNRKGNAKTKQSDKDILVRKFSLNGFCKRISLTASIIIVWHLT
jgi:hypothetical protein